MSKIKEELTDSSTDHSSSDEEVAVTQEKSAEMPYMSAETAKPDTNVH